MVTSTNRSVFLQIVIDVYDHIQATDLQFPELTTVGSLWLGQWAILVPQFLERLQFPSLETISGYIIIVDYPVLNTVEFSSVTSVGGSISIKGCPSIERIDFQRLLHARWMKIAGIQSALDLSFSNLISVTQSIYLEDVNVSTLQMQVLETVGQDFFLGPKSTGTTPSLNDLKLNKLRSVNRSLTLRSYGGANLKLPNLTHVVQDLSLIHI